jgi:PAS domain S-box-containing protein
LLLSPLFSYNHSRDAFALRVIGHQVGPVLRPERRVSPTQPFDGVDQRRAGSHSSAVSGEIVSNDVGYPLPRGSSALVRRPRASPPGEAYAQRVHAPSLGAGWERLFWLVFRNSSNAIYLLDGRRRVVEANDPGVELLGRSRGEMLGASIVDSVRPSERHQAAKEWQAFLRSGEYAGTRHVVRPDGSEVEIEFAAQLAYVGDRRLAIYVTLASGDSRLSPGAARGRSAALTNREREVVTLIALGHGTTAIAQDLHISTATVRTHVRNAMAKLGAHTRAQLVAVALCTAETIHTGQLTVAGAEESPE